jgi:hypothetical protein
MKEGKFMAADDLRVHFHLTPRGWIAGPRWYFDKLQGDDLIERPSDTIASFELHITQRSEWSGEHREWKEIWRSEPLAGQNIEAIQAKFGKRPDEDSSLPIR